MMKPMNKRADDGFPGKSVYKFFVFDVGNVIRRETDETASTDKGAGRPILLFSFGSRKK